MSLLTDRFFLNETLLVQWIWIVPNGHTLAGFPIDALRLAAMSTLHLRALHKTKKISLEGIFISCQPRLKKQHLLQLGIHGDPA